MPDTKALERDLTAKLGLKTEIAFDGKGGALTIHYQSLEQLDELIAKLGSDSASGDPSLRALVYRQRNSPGRSGPGPRAPFA